MAVNFLDGIAVAGTSTFSSTTNLDGTNFMPNYIYHTGDGDTYFGFSAANTFKVNAGGATRLTVNATNVTLNTPVSNSATGSSPLFLDGSNNINKATQTFGSNAFNSTTIPTNNNQLTNGEGYTTNTGTVTSANGSNNRVATFSSATALNGESDLTFDGSTLETSGTIEAGTFIVNATNGPEIDIEGAAGFNMRHLSANQPMFFLTAAGTGEIKFGTNNVNSRVIITSTGALKSTVSLAVGAITPSTTVGRIDASNDVVAFSTSDIRLKDNIKTIDKALDKVNSIQGIEFDWIEKEEIHGNSGHDIGVIAQEIEKILPDVVTTRDNGYKAVKYEKIVPLLIEAIKDLSKQVDGLKRLI